MKTYKPKYNFKQQVYAVYTNVIRSEEYCSVCAGNGYIIVDGNKFICTECRYGRIELEPTQKTTYEKITIGKISIEHTCKYEGNDHYSSHNEEYKEQYMAYETGIGSGTLYYVENLFLTEEEAKAECLKRDKEGNMKECPKCKSKDTKQTADHNSHGYNGYVCNKCNHQWGN